MAKQAGVIPITGTIDELTFYKHPDDGHLVKKKSRVDGTRVKTDPNYTQTMLNAAEFTTSLRSAQLLRKALARLLFPIADGKLSSRMNQELARVVQLDAINHQGKRRPYGSTLSALEGFDFNRQLLLRDTFFAPYSIDDQGNKELSIHVGSFTPSLHIQAPAYVEFIQLVSGMAVVDFEAKHFAHAFWETDRILRDQEPIDVLRFTYPLQIPPGYTLFLTLGVLFYAQLDKIPKDATSQRKRRKLKKYGKSGLTAFTGALSIIKVIPGEVEVGDVSAEDERKDDAWEMDGLGIA